MEEVVSSKGKARHPEGKEGFYDIEFDRRNMGTSKCSPAMKGKTRRGNLKPSKLQSKDKLRGKWRGSELGTGLVLGTLGSRRARSFK